MTQKLNPVQSNPDTKEWESAKYLVKSTCKYKRGYIAEYLRVELQESGLR